MQMKTNNPENLEHFTWVRDLQLAKKKFRTNMDFIRSAIYYDSPI